MLAPLLPSSMDGLPVDVPLAVRRVADGNENAEPVTGVLMPLGVPQSPSPPLPLDAVRVTEGSPVQGVRGDAVSGGRAALTELRRLPGLVGSTHTQCHTHVNHTSTTSTSLASTRPLQGYATAPTEAEEYNKQQQRRGMAVQRWHGGGLQDAGQHV